MPGTYEDFINFFKNFFGDDDDDEKDVEVIPDDENLTDKEIGEKMKKVHQLLLHHYKAISKSVSWMTSVSWMSRKLNPDKTEFILFGSKVQHDKLEACFPIDILGSQLCPTYKVHLMYRKNKKEHHTKMFKNDDNGKEKFVIRRGQEFFIEVTVNTRFDPTEDVLEFQFDKGKKPQVSKKTRQNVKCYKDKKSAEQACQAGKWLYAIYFDPIFQYLLMKFGYTVSVYEHRHSVTNQSEVTKRPPVARHFGQRDYMVEWWDLLPGKDDKTVFKKTRNVPDLEMYGYIFSIDSSSQTSTIIAAICTQPDAFVGKYKLTNVKVFDLDANKETKRRYVKLMGKDIFLLFNAWCKDDDVYIEEEDEREEYVLRETGRIWKNSSSFRGTPWNYGQGEDYCLRTAIQLLEECYLAPSTHGDPVLVSRAMTAMLNSCDSDAGDRVVKGVLAGNWSGKYEGGTSPSQWTSSVSILKEYIDTGKPVKYGQCWVFSALLTTVCRTLGIPCRPVTNFSSAHDNDGSCTIDKHSNEKGEPLSHLNDSVWNFHVWNEVYMKRKDLPPGYDGWQAIDATPQECSEGIFQCGPAPMQAIYEGSVHIGYDTKFLFGEVHGMRIQWTVKKNGDMIPKRQTELPPVGRCISTKKVGNNWRNDLTSCYKPEDGSEEDKKVLERALAFSSRKQYLEKAFGMDDDDVNFDTKFVKGKHGDVDVCVTAQNKSGEHRHVNYKLTGIAASYNDRAIQAIYRNGNDGVDYKLAPYETQNWSQRIQGKDYINLLTDEQILELNVWMVVKETDQIYTNIYVVEIDKPEIQVSVSNDKPKVGEEIQVTMKFENDMDWCLTEGVLHIDGPGILTTMVKKLGNDVDKGRTIEMTVPMTPIVSGEKEILAMFTSRQVIDINGSVSVFVQD